MHRRGLGRWWLPALIATTGISAGLFILDGGSPKADARAGPAGGGLAGAMTETERRAYIEANVLLEQLTVTPDRKPQDERSVPGLLRFSGTIRNRGTRALAEAHLSVYPEDGDGKVVAGYVEEILHGRALEPGETRDFAFRIPARSAFSGSFGHSLR